MEMERKSFDTLVLAAKWLGSLASILLLGFAFMAGRSLREIRETSKNEAKSLFEAEMRKAATETGSLRASFKEVAEVEAELTRLRAELSGYSELTAVVRTATGFDPLVQYQSLNKEIDRRRDATIRLMRGDDEVNIADTIADVDFRQRAAVVFEALISSARDGHKNGNLTIDANTLFNASQNASAADMEFVALEFLDIASTVSRGKRPEIQASRIRKRIAMSRYHENAEAGGDEQAWKDIEEVLQTVRGFDLHLVVSEAFNIGMQLADPVRMSDTIRQHLPEQLQRASYTNFIRARLCLLGGENTEEWAQGYDLFRAALDTMAQEAPSVRWFKHSAEDAPRMLSDNPNLLEDEMGDALLRAFGGCRDIRHFVSKFGAAAAQAFQQLGLLSELIQMPDDQHGFMEMLEALKEREEAAGKGDDDPGDDPSDDRI